jgi:soluble lytic murein transglycosylase-like protein
VSKKITGWLVALAAVATVAMPSDTPTAAAQEASPDVAYALNHAADAYGVGRGCLWTIARRESRFRPWVDNSQGSGARGLMQFKDATWRFMSRAAGYGWAISHPRESQGGLRHWGWC